MPDTISETDIFIRFLKCLTSNRNIRMEVVMNTEIELSKEQKLFIEEALAGYNILVDACIGSGKTTAIQHLCKAIPEEKRVLYLTYNRLLKFDAKNKIGKKRNCLVQNYHGFAYGVVSNIGLQPGRDDSIQLFLENINDIKVKFDVLILDEYQDIDQEISEMLKCIKSLNHDIQIVAVGDMCQKIYDKTTLDVYAFIQEFLGDYVPLEFTQCFRLNREYAKKLGDVWEKQIIGVNETSQVTYKNLQEIVDFLSRHEVKDILCLGKREGRMTYVLNRLEKDYPEKFNKHTVYASITDEDKPKISQDKLSNVAIFTTFDSSKGLERKCCVIFDFTVEYWENRNEKWDAKYEILRNIFCVASSRGKSEIVFALTDDTSLLGWSTLATPIKNKDSEHRFSISNMFDFKYIESVEECYRALNIKGIDVEDHTIIDIPSHDGLIDLSPCIGNYQEASYFDNYDIDKEVDALKFIRKHLVVPFSEEIKQSSIESKILALTANETGHARYFRQVSIPYITEEQKQKLNDRLATLLQKDEDVQQPCSISLNRYPGINATATGLADVVKNGVVYELKFVSQLAHVHFLQCATYVVAMNLEKGILWNVRTNQKFEITVPDREAYLDLVAMTVLKKRERP